MRRRGAHEDAMEQRAGGGGSWPEQGCGGRQVAGGSTATPTTAFRTASWILCFFALAAAAPPVMLPGARSRAAPGQAHIFLFTASWRSSVFFFTASTQLCKNISFYSDLWPSKTMLFTMNSAICFKNHSFYNELYTVGLCAGNLLFFHG